MLLLDLSISCHHLHPHPPNMLLLVNNVSFHIIIFIIVVSRRPHIKEVGHCSVQLKCITS